MVAAKKPAPAAGKDTVVSSAGDTDLVLREKSQDAGKAQKAGEPGPPSSLKTGVGSATGASAGGDANFEGRRGDSTAEAGAQVYSVQCHTDDKGVFVENISARSGDEAAQKALATAGYKGMSIRGVTPVTDPDPNSLGGERDASIMIANAEAPLGGGDPLGTAANRKATEELGRADIKELGE